MSRQLIGKDGLRRQTQNMYTDDDNRKRDPLWWYGEHKGGLSIGRAGAGCAWLPIAQIRAYLKRHNGEG